MTPPLPACTSRDVERALLRLGFAVDRQSGSHRIYRRASDHRRVVLPIHSGDLKPELLRQTIQDAGVTPEEFHALLRRRRVA